MTETTTSTEPSFFQSRMDILGITPENNKVKVYDPEAEFPAPSEYTMPVFEEDKSTGNIEIYYYTIDGEVARYLQMGEGKTASLNAKSKFYKTIRLKEPLGDMKYRMPHGQPTRPWFPPALVEKFLKKEKIPTLILTEGAFKAMRGSIAGLDVVGLPSITCYKDHEGNLYNDIRRIIEDCEVINLIILWDGDCRDISKKDLATGDELTKRPNTFFQSAKKIAELVQKLEFQKTRDKVSVWFGHIRPDSHRSRPKGLDDLLCAVAPEGHEGRVVKELTDLQTQSYYFFTKSMANGTGQIHKYYGLHAVETFFQLHREVIGSREFKYKGDIHRWSEANDELEMLAPEWANRVKWVGDEFFLEDLVPSAHGIDIRKLICYKQGQFDKMFGKEFWKRLQHHRAFVNIPDHFNYQQVIEKADGAKYYNRYFPFPHVPTEGTWGTIMELLIHIFGTEEVTHSITGKTYSPVELALDYIQLLLTQPTQMLPVLCLYSPENNTGKSTLGKLLMTMFGDNAIPIGNNELQSEFNDTFVDKLLAVCEETLLERKRDAERIKALSTSEKITVNPKGQKQFSMDYFCKFIFTSNNLRMLYVSKHDQRYWIIKVPVITKENPNMLEEMRAEIPAFVHALKNRKMATEKEGRMWFHASLIRTRIFSDMVQVNEPTDATNMREQLREWFIQDKDLMELRMTLKEVKTEFFSAQASASWMQEIIRDYIGADLLRDPQTQEAIFERGFYTKYEIKHSMEGEDLVAVKKAYRGRPYVFLRSKFLTGSEVRYQTDIEAAPAPALAHPPVIQTAMQLEDRLPEEGVGDDLPF